MNGNLMSYHGQPSKSAIKAVRALAKIIRTVPESDAEEIVRFVMAEMADGVFDYHSKLLGHHTDKSPEGMALDNRTINRLTAEAIERLDEANQPEVYGPDGVMISLVNALQQIRAEAKA
ncbi:MAG: hypothetical protein HEQ38_17145 [Gemmatimonas sp.]|nr:hypothetical protein [Gemmatimonas sp.]